jgi:ribosomal protein S6
MLPSIRFIKKVVSEELCSPEVIEYVTLVKDKQADIYLFEKWLSKQLEVKLSKQLAISYLEGNIPPAHYHWWFSGHKYTQKNLDKLERFCRLSSHNLIKGTTLI